MITVKAAPDVRGIKIDKDDDIIPISVGLYKFFLASGAPGLEAKTLYEHLIFTARMQETSQVYANAEYIRKGLGWGLAKIKKAKAWLYAAGLIEYIQYRDTEDGGGRLSQVYIKLRFLMTRETLAARMAGIPAYDGEVIIPEEVPVPHDQAQLDFLDEFGVVAPEEPVTAGSEIDPPAPMVVDIDFTGGSVTAPPVDRTTGDERQMLEANNEMLEANKEKEPTSAGEEETDPRAPEEEPRNPDPFQPHRAEFAYQCFELMAGMPPKRVSIASNKLNFLLRDFPQGYEHLRSLHLHSDEVLTALENLKAVLELPEGSSWYNAVVSFRTFCRGIVEFLPDRFSLDRYRKTPQAHGTTGSGGVAGFRRTGPTQAEIDAAVARTNETLARLAEKRAAGR